MDIGVSSLALAAAAFPMVVVWAVVRLRLGSPVVFRQQRPGINGAPFELVKFRTMTDEKNANGELLPDSDRLTPVGRFLRATSIDELPELFNVLSGAMSLVGPRPLLTRYTPFYTLEEARRLTVRPGITGWAQVNGRNTLSWDERLAMDVWYVDNWTLPLDLRILAQTLVQVLRRDGVVVDTAANLEDLDVARQACR